MSKGTHPSRKVLLGRVLFVVLFPLLVLFVFALGVERQHLPDVRKCIYGGAFAYLPLLWGSFRFMFGKSGKPANALPSIVLPWALAAAALAYGVVAAQGAMVNRTPAGWSSKLPRYPGVLLAAERCDAYDCAASYTPRRSEVEGRKRIDRYDVALVEARLPAQGFPATCASLGGKCRIYAVADVRLLECLNATETVMSVRYGSQPCPDGESEPDASPTY